MNRSSELTIKHSAIDNIHPIPSPVRGVIVIVVANSSHAQRAQPQKSVHLTRNPCHTFSLSPHTSQILSVSDVANALQTGAMNNKHASLREFAGL